MLLPLQRLPKSGVKAWRVELKHAGLRVLGAPAVSPVKPGLKCTNTRGRTRALNK